MNRVKKLVGGILAITLCVSASAQTKLPPGWQSSYVKITQMCIRDRNRTL